ncbi:hypothetical protein PI124_g825 [Phytophthora idaei]|nr:hypothetical protein PI125_g729 [Phytophthora idaei]KAG3254612.1 hypothetical protein PI124_g825 [Phytophthora idaei]
MEDEFLNAVFRFKHKAPRGCQDPELCKASVQHFAAFVANLEALEGQDQICGRVEPLGDDRVVPASAVTKHELDGLKEVCHRLEDDGTVRHTRGDVWYDPWLPMYGCAIQRTMLSATKVELKVIFVDGWERMLHLLPTGQCVHCSVPKTYHFLCCGDLDTNLVEKYEDAFQLELLQAQRRHGSLRSAKTHELGHQKTPQFIKAVVQRAIASITGISESCSITTREAQRMWGNTLAIFLEIRAGHSSKRRLSRICAAGKACFHGCDAVNDLFFMLQVVVQQVVNLLESGYDVSVLQGQCTRLQGSIEGFVDALIRKTADQYVLPEEKTLERLNDLKCGVEICSPKREEEPNRNESIEERQRRALISLEACEFLDGASCGLEDLLEWEKSTTAPESYKRILVMRTIEAFMFERSQFLRDGAGEDSFSMECMQDLVTRYLQVVREWRKQPQLTSFLDVEQRSRELLVVWIAFCLVQQKCAVEVPLCSQYNIALNWRDLKVAVLSNQVAITALQRVVKYIHGWNEKTKGPQLFHLTDQGPTFEFGREFVKTSEELKAAYMREVEVWEAHVTCKWNEIESKKEEAVNLREELSSLNEELRSKQSELAIEEARLLQAYPYGNQWQYRESPSKTELQGKIRLCSSIIQQMEAKLKHAIAMPQYMVRPLPPTESDAYKVLFMLLMPRNLEILGNLCLIAQRALAPAKSTTEMMAIPMISHTTWQAFHHQYTPSQQSSYASDKVFTASPSEVFLPQSYGPKSVDDLSSLSQYVSKCVWNPTLHGTALTWEDSVGQVLDPFKATPASVIDSFTEKLREPFEEFQWLNTWPGESDTRGNLVYANLYQQPKDFEKTAFIALGSLHAYPN